MSGTAGINTPRLVRCRDFDTLWQTAQNPPHRGNLFLSVCFLIQIASSLHPLCLGAAGDMDFLFPLRCSSFEQYMLADDRPSHPMTSALETELQGAIDPERLRQALPAALARHPLLLARIQGRGREARWIPDSSEPEFTVLESPVAWPSDRLLDLTQRSGLRACFQKTNEGGRLTIHVHHAACDALSMILFVVEWLLISAGEGQRLPPSDPFRLRRREDLTGIPPAYGRSRRWKNIATYLARKRPSPLANPRPQAPSAPPADSAYVVTKLTREQTALLRAQARQSGASINDWLIATLFLCMANWNANDAGQSSRLVIPVNRRDSEERFLSACNKIGYKMITRPNVLADFESLLAGVVEEMAPARTNPQGVFSYLQLLQVFSRWGLMSRVVQRYSCFATAVFSNLGDLTRHFETLADVEDHRLRIGPITIAGFRCASPRRPHTLTTVVALTYDGELNLCSSSLGSGFDAETSLEFLRQFQQAIIRSLPLS